VSKPEAYSADELLQALKDRQGGYSLAQYAAEIGISGPMLSQILGGTRSIGNEKVLEFLAPRGMVYVHRDQWLLLPKSLGKTLDPPLEP
jgi:transcriptional regulator with XRE-family HTH domain